MRLSSQIRVDSAQKLLDRPEAAPGRAAFGSRDAARVRQPAADGSSGDDSARTGTTGRMPSSAASGDAGSASSPSR